MAKNFTLEKTKNKDLFRVVNRDGDWQLYFHKPSKQYLRSVTAILDRSYPKGARFVKWALLVSKEEAEKKLKETGERGSKLHNAVERLLDKGSFDRTIDTVWNPESKQEEFLNNNEWDALLSFQNFWDRHEPILLANELSVYSLKNEYAGTVDLILKLTKNCGVKTCKCDKLIGKVGVWDLKTGGGIYPSYYSQVAAYGNAESLKDYKIKPEYTAIVRIGTNHVTTGGYEIVCRTKDEAQKDWQRFLDAKDLDDFDYELFDPAKEVYEIPDKIKIKITKPKKRLLSSR